MYLSRPCRRAGSQPIASEIFQYHTSGRSVDDSNLDGASAAPFLKKSSSTSAMNTIGIFLNGACSVDVVVKLYIPDHTHKLIGISEVRNRGRAVSMAIGDKQSWPDR